MNRLGAAFLVLVVGVCQVNCSRTGEVLSRRRSGSVADAAAVAGGSGSGARDAAAPPSGDDDTDPGPLAALTGSGLLSLGDYHACALEQGSLYCWGQNDAGQLGLGDELPRSVPGQVGAAGQWRAVALGGSHTCAINKEAQVLCFGSGEAGQLGQGGRDGSSEPRLVSLPAPARSLGLGSSHSCAVLDTDELYCWGHNFEGQLGLDDTYSDEPDARDGLKPQRVVLEPVATVAGGDGHSCAIARSGVLYCWGRNSQKQSGPFEEIQFRAPRALGAEGTWAVVSAGQGHSCALADTGSLWCWGENAGGESEGPLGLPVAEAERPSEVSGTRWLGLSTDTFHSCAIDVAQELWCWGRNIEGQLGLGDTVGRGEPTRVQRSAVSVAVGRFFSCVMDSAGAVACTGASEAGQLGTADDERRSRFTSIPLSSDP